MKQKHVLDHILEIVIAIETWIGIDQDATRSVLTGQIANSRIKSL